MAAQRAKTGVVKLARNIIPQRSKRIGINYRTAQTGRNFVNKLANISQSVTDIFSSYGEDHDSLYFLEVADVDLCTP